jgi:hypothetical protein
MCGPELQNWAGTDFYPSILCELPCYEDKGIKESRDDDLSKVTQPTPFAQSEKGDQEEEHTWCTVGAD